MKGAGMGMFQFVTFCSWVLMVWTGAVSVSAKKSAGGDTIAAVLSILYGGTYGNLVDHAFVVLTFECSPYPSLRFPII